MHAYKWLAIVSNQSEFSRCMCVFVCVHDFSYFKSALSLLILNQKKANIKTYTRYSICFISVFFQSHCNHIVHFSLRIIFLRRKKLVFFVILFLLFFAYYAFRFDFICLISVINQISHCCCCNWNFPFLIILYIYFFGINCFLFHKHMVHGMERNWNDTMKLSHLACRNATIFRSVYFFYKCIHPMEISLLILYIIFPQDPYQINEEKL